MATLFELSSDQLLSLLSALRPDLIEAKAIEIDDIPSMQSKVTEWLLLHNLPTLYKFERAGEKWIVPSRRQKNPEKKRHPYMDFSPSVVVNQPTAKESPPFPSYGSKFGAACCWRQRPEKSDAIFPVACCASTTASWKTPLQWCSRRV